MDRLLDRNTMTELEFTQCYRNMHCFESLYNGHIYSHYYRYYRTLARSTRWLVVPRDGFHNASDELKAAAETIIDLSDLLRMTRTMDMDPEGIIDELAVAIEDFYSLFRPPLQTG
jgi:hypothetical protein